MENLGLMFLPCFWTGLVVQSVHSHIFVELIPLFYLKPHLLFLKPHSLFCLMVRTHPDLLIGPLSCWSYHSTISPIWPYSCYCGSSKPALIFSPIMFISPPKKYGMASSRSRPSLSPFPQKLLLGGSEAGARPCKINLKWDGHRPHPGTRG